MYPVSLCLLCCIVLYQGHKSQGRTQVYVLYICEGVQSKLPQNVTCWITGGDVEGPKDTGRALYPPLQLPERIVIGGLVHKKLLL